MTFATGLYKPQVALTCEHAHTSALTKLTGLAYILRDKIKASENRAIGACYLNTSKCTGLLHKYQFSK